MEAKSSAAAQSCADTGRHVNTTGVAVNVRLGVNEGCKVSVKVSVGLQVRVRVTVKVLVMVGVKVTEPDTGVGVIVLFEKVGEGVSVAVITFASTTFERAPVFPGLFIDA